MKQLATLYASVLCSAAFAAALLGADNALTVAYGAIAIMALLIAATFLWLWQARATPLALGMSLSWAGSGLTLGWWWCLQLAGLPAVPDQEIFLFAALALLIAGATVHFMVIQGTFGWHGLTFLVPVLGAFVLSLGVLAFI